MTRSVMKSIPTQSVGMPFWTPCVLFSKNQVTSAHEKPVLQDLSFSLFSFLRMTFPRKSRALAPAKSAL